MPFDLPMPVFNGFPPPMQPFDLSTMSANRFTIADFKVRPMAGHPLRPTDGQALLMSGQPIQHLLIQPGYKSNIDGSAHAKDHHQEREQPPRFNKKHEPQNRSVPSAPPPVETMDEAVAPSPAENLAAGSSGHQSTRGSLDSLQKLAADLPASTLETVSHTSEVPKMQTTIPIVPSSRYMGSSSAMGHEPPLSPNQRMFVNTNRHGGGGNYRGRRGAGGNRTGDRDENGRRCTTGPNSKPRDKARVASPSTKFSLETASFPPLQPSSVTSTKHDATTETAKMSSTPNSTFTSSSSAPSFSMEIGGTGASSHIEWISSSHSQSEKSSKSTSPMPSSTRTAVGSVALPGNASDSDSSYGQPQKMSYAQIAQKKKEPNEQPSADEHRLNSHPDNGSSHITAAAAGGGLGSVSNNSMLSGHLAAVISSPSSPPASSSSPGDHFQPSYRGSGGHGRYSRGRGRGGRDNSHRGGGGRDNRNSSYGMEHSDRSHDFNKPNDHRFNYEQSADDGRSRSSVPPSVRPLGTDK